MAISPPVTARWTAAAHDHAWTDAANWTPAAPGSGVVGLFGRGGARVDLAAAGATLDVGQIEVRGGSVRLAGGTLHWKAPPYDKRLFADVGLRIDDGGSLTVDATASLLGLQTMALGEVSAATLDIQGVVSDSQVYAGRAGAVSVTVEGAVARWVTSGIDQSFQFGGGATASLVVRDGGRVSDAPIWSNANASSSMTIGGTTAGASVSVTGRGSELRFQVIQVGGSYSGTLDIAAGGLVVDLGANVGESGDASVSVSGAQSAWNNLNGLFVHGGAPHGALSVTDHATVRFGEYGLQLDGEFSIDATARLVGDVVVMGGGALTGLATAGEAESTVNITQSIELASNPAISGSNVGNFFGSAAGVTLVLAGQVAIQSSGYDPLSVGAGHVVLTNADNGDFAIALYGGVLEFAQAGASGTGAISFLDTAGATLQFDQTGSIANPISGFGASAQEVIDLQAVADASPPTLSWQPGSGHGPLLQVSDGTDTVTLALGGGYKLSGFTTASDGHGGTALSYHHA